MANGHIISSDLQAKQLALVQDSASEISTKLRPQHVRGYLLSTHLTAETVYIFGQISLTVVGFRSE